MSGDHLERLRAWRTFASKNRPGYDHMRDISYESAPVRDADVDALLAEVEQLRADLEAARIRLDLLALSVSADGLRALLAVVEQQAAPEPGLTDRQAKLLAAFRREGGDWAPMRAQGVLVRAGYAAVSKERAHQIMKQLAERGYLEQVRPRAYTYRLKTEAPQQPEQTGGAK